MSKKIIILSCCIFLLFSATVFAYHHYGYYYDPYHRYYYYRPHYHHYRHSHYMRRQQSAEVHHVKLNRIKINLGDKLCSDVRFNKKNLLICSPSADEIAKSNWPEVILKLQSDPRYIDMFQNVYNDKITQENITNAILEYESSLAKPSRFDDYINGDTKALTPEEIRGYELFKSYGCAACHSGSDFGGSKFKKMGVARNYLIEHHTVIRPEDLGLYEVTKNTNDVYVFKVPALRNVSNMDSYYHNGSIKTLPEAVHLMGKYQLNVDIPEGDVRAITAFLNSLTVKRTAQK